MQTITHKKKLVPIIANIAAWVCFFALPYLVFFPGLREFSMSNQMLAIIICNNIFLVFFYYLNTQLLIPKFLVQEKWLLYVSSIIACLIFFLFIPRQIAIHIVPPEIVNPLNELPNTLNSNRQRFMRSRRRSGNDYFNTAIFLLVMTIGTCITIVRRWLETEQHRKESENEKLNTELSFLKSQVNPHFFFNTLNNIYSLAIVRSEKTAPAVMKLSSIMRYILSETDQNLVPLQNEIDFLHNYIDLQQVRLTEKVSVDFTIEGNTSELLIAPLIFIPFVENAFKYGISTKEKSSIAIHIKSEGTTIHFTSNNFVVQSENNLTENTGIGINNVKRRLALLYPNKHQLTVSEQNGYYLVNLEINTLL